MGFFFQDLSRAWLRRGLLWISLGGRLSAALLYLHLRSDPLARPIEWSNRQRYFDLLERAQVRRRVLRRFSRHGLLDPDDACDMLARA